MKETFSAKVFEIEQGRNEIVLNEKTAWAMGIGIHDRVELRHGRKKTTAIVNLAHHAVHNHQLGLFEEAAQALGAKNGSRIHLVRVPRPESLEAIRRKLDGKVLEPSEVSGIIRDLMAERLATPELAAFIAAVHTRGMNVEETVALTEAIYKSGKTLRFRSKPVVSEHSIGGVAGDRTSMLFVPIMASMDITVPKTCSRAISSAAGTADVMELFCPVNLTAKKMKAVVEKTHGCLVWGGAVNMAAADDKLIRIRHPLRLDPHPLLLSSILAKKKAEGAHFVLLDIPIGAGAKVRDVEEARALAKSFTSLGAQMGMKVEVTITDGSEPLMSSIGPALEAKAVLETLEKKRVNGLTEKAVQLCGIALAMAKGVSRETGVRQARQRLESGHALEKFREIVQAQGGDPDVSSNDVRLGDFVRMVRAGEKECVQHIDNRRVSKVARALGSPEDHQAGLVLHAKKGDCVQRGDDLFELYASSKAKLSAGMRELRFHNPMDIEKIVIDVV